MGQADWLGELIPTHIKHDERAGANIEKARKRTKGGKSSELREEPKNAILVVSGCAALHLGLPIPQPNFHQLVQEDSRVLLTVLHEHFDHLEPIFHKVVFVIPFQWG